MILRMALALLAVFAPVRVAQPQVRRIDTNTVYDFHDCAECSPRLIVVDGDDPPTVLEIVAPAFVSPRLFARAVELRGTSVLNMSGGEVLANPSTVLATSQTTVNVTGGEIISEDGHGIFAMDQARVSIAGGVVIGGDVGDATALALDDEARADIRSGTLYGAMGLTALRVMGNGHATIRGGTIVNDIVVQNLGIIDIFSGTFDFSSFRSTYLLASGNSVVNIYGGNFNPGENFRDYLLAGNDEAAVNIYGTDFSTEPHIRDESRLRARLADGSPIDVLIRGRVFLHEIPEPSTLGLGALGLAGLGLLARRQRRATTVHLRISRWRIRCEHMHNVTSSHTGQATAAGSRSTGDSPEALQPQDRECLHRLDSPVHLL